ncbi:MAG: thioredoxin [Prevotellaceae bacterium]|jgi:thioredoxin|nr:thioredoxin [Prevotellaceae bacterium]
MKKIIFILLTALISSICSAQTPPPMLQRPQVVHTISLTKAEFLKRVANYEKSPKVWKYLGDKPCLIDFYTTWCGPCKRLAPVLEELAEEYKGKLYIYKVDTEKEPQLAAAFGVKSIPTLLFCPKGADPQIAMGALPKAELVRIFEQVLKVK